MKVLVKGAGDIATGVAYQLYQAGFRVLMTDVEKPTSIRRTVCFSEAIVKGKTTVEGVTAVRIDDVSEAERIIDEGMIPVIVDPKASCNGVFRADAIVDAILGKENLGTTIHDAPVVIAMGPGFCAGVDCHAVIETMRGHTLGRIYYKGSAKPNTGIPGMIGGYSLERILRAPVSGTFQQVRQIGDIVKAGEICAYVDGTPMATAIDGVVRGILPTGTIVTEGMKSGDVDPRGAVVNCYTISDKALCMGGAAVVALMHLSNLIK